MLRNFLLLIFSSHVWFNLNWGIFEILGTTWLGVSFFTHLFNFLVCSAKSLDFFCLWTVFNGILFKPILSHSRLALHLLLANLDYSVKLCQRFRFNIVFWVCNCFSRRSNLVCGLFFRKEHFKGLIICLLWWVVVDAISRFRSSSALSSCLLRIALTWWTEYILTLFTFSCSPVDHFFFLIKSCINYWHGQRLR